MELFTIEGNTVKPTKEILLIYPFSEIWDRDSDIKKVTAMQQFKYIEFMCSPKKTNPFRGYEKEKKEQKVIENVFGKEAVYKPDNLVKMAMEQYLEFFYNASPSLAYLEDARGAANMTRQFLSEVDLSSETKAGYPKYKPKDITSALVDTLNVLKTLDALEEKVQQELFENTKTKNNREINMFERRPA